MNDFRVFVLCMMSGFGGIAAHAWTTRELQQSRLTVVDESCVAAGTCVKVGRGENFMLLPTNCRWIHVAQRQLDGGVEALAYCEPLDGGT